MSTNVALTTLQDTIGRALDRFPAKRAHIERGAARVALGHVSQVGPDTFDVRSPTHPDVTYHVDDGAFSDKAAGCNCKGAQRHPGRSCKHEWAVDLLQVSEERQRRLNPRESEQARRAPVTADQVALAYARSIRCAG